MNIEKKFEDRKKEFMDRYEKLVQELKVDVGTAPAFFPIGGGAFGITMQRDIVDLENAPQLSPFQS